MKVFKVLIDHDCPSNAGNIERVEEHYGANTINEVFIAAIERAAILDGEIIAVILHSENVSVLSL
jgi:hypothetical protein